MIIRNREVWRPVAGYEGAYMVSSYGAVKSMDRTISVSRRGYKETEQRYKGRDISQTINSSGYLKCSLSKQGKGLISYFAHNLVADAFVGGRSSGLVVNHKDGNRLNNRFDNLEFCTRSENIKAWFSNQSAYGPGLRNRIFVRSK
jgi:hypothetical protein